MIPHKRSVRPYEDDENDQDDVSRGNKRLRPAATEPPMDALIPEGRALRRNDQPNQRLRNTHSRLLRERSFPQVLQTTSEDVELLSYLFGGRFTNPQANQPQQVSPPALLPQVSLLTK